MHTPADLKLEATSADRLIDLRHAVLRQGLPREEAMFAGDALAAALHVLATIDGLTVGCATYHPSVWQGKSAWRLRGMATHPDHQRRGVGRAMLAFAEEQLLARNKSRQLWCNARLNAIPFYQSLGWTIESHEFDIPTAGPHYVMAKLL